MRIFSQLIQKEQLLAREVQRTARENLSVLSTVLGKWIQWVAGRQNQDVDVDRLYENATRVMRNGVLRMQQMLLSTALDSWSVRTQEQVSAPQNSVPAVCWAARRSHQGHTVIRQRRARATVTKICHRMQHVGVASAFGSWESCVSEQKRARHVVGKCIARMQMTTLSAGLDTWMKWTVELKKARHVVGKCIRRMQMVSVFTALAAWVAWTSDRLQEHLIVRRVVLRMKTLLISDVIGTWATRTLARQHARVVLAKVCRRMQHMGLASAFRSCAYRARCLHACQAQASQPFLLTLCNCAL